MTLILIAPDTFRMKCNPPAGSARRRHNVGAVVCIPVRSNRYACFSTLLGPSPSPEVEYRGAFPAFFQSALAPILNISNSYQSDFRCSFPKRQTVLYILCIQIFTSDVLWKCSPVCTATVSDPAKAGLSPALFPLPLPACRLPHCSHLSSCHVRPGPQSLYLSAVSAHPIATGLSRS